MNLVHICSINSIVSGLRDLAISSSSRPRDDPKTKALVNAAKSGADAPLPELQSVISQVAVNIHGLYVLKDKPKLFIVPYVPSLYYKDIHI